MKKSLLFIFLSVLLAACSSSKPIFDYDTKTNFLQYKTFNFFEDAGKGLSELDKKRIEKIIIEKLKINGIKQVEENPQFYVNYFSKDIKVDERPRIGIGIGGGGNVGFGISGGIPIGNREVKLELTIDFVEATNNNLFWQGVISKKLKEKTQPQERDEFFNNIVSKLLENYPPKK